MVKQESKSWIRFAYIAFAIIVMMMSWESNKMQASALIREEIPQDSIRIRILGNSDSVADQWVKREVRDALNEQLSGWVNQPHSLGEARTLIRSKLDQIELLSNKTLHDRGFNYEAKVELDTVPFPEKTVGSEVYPAGQYEALRVTLGKGEGQNWWCVLFPPLCFMGGQIVSKNDVEEQEAADKAKTGTVGSSALNERQEKAGKEGTGKPAAATAKASTAKSAASVKRADAPAAKSVSKAAAGGKTVSAPAGEVKTAAAAQPEMEVRSFFWDLLKSWFA
ncbi:stage II sporulation protein R [Paenibacillus thalictri]|nr:stage II sporulation protein R [Paenibacillus thalictri]